MKKGLRDKVVLEKKQLYFVTTDRHSIALIIQEIQEQAYHLEL